MTAIERLNEILKQLKTLEDETTTSHFGRTPTSILTALASFMDDLPDITQQLETAIIEIEEEKEDAILARY